MDHRSFKSKLITAAHDEQMDETMIPGLLIKNGLKMSVGRWNSATVFLCTMQTDINRWLNGEAARNISYRQPSEPNNVRSLNYFHRVRSIVALMSRPRYHTYFMRKLFVLSV